MQPTSPKIYKDLDPTIAQFKQDIIAATSIEQRTKACHSLIWAQLCTTFPPEQRTGRLIMEFKAAKVSPPPEIPGESVEDQIARILSAVHDVNASLTQKTTKIVMRKKLKEVAEVAALHRRLQKHSHLPDWFHAISTKMREASGSETRNIHQLNSAYQTVCQDRGKEFAERVEIMRACVAYADHSAMSVSLVDVDSESFRAFYSSYKTDLAEKSFAEIKLEPKAKCKHLGPKKIRKARRIQKRSSQSTWQTAQCRRRPRHQLAST